MLFSVRVSREVLCEVGWADRDYYRCWSRIGAAGARLFAAVAVVDVDGDSAEAIADTIRSQGGVAHSYAVDVGDPEMVSCTVSQTIADFGHIDIAWSNAGAIRALGTPVDEIAVDDWHAVLRVNLDGPFFLAQSVIPHLKAQRSGCIIHTASIARIIASIPGRAPYTVSKGALLAFTRLLSLLTIWFWHQGQCDSPWSGSDSIRGNRRRIHERLRHELAKILSRARDGL